MRKEETTMRFMRQITVGSVVCGSLLMPVGSVLAESVNIDSTGAGSSQVVTIENNLNYSTSNTSVVVVSNVNEQTAQTGDVTASKNTVVGDLSSGNASNTNATTTTVGVTNTPVVLGDSTGNGGSGGTPAPGNAGGVGGAGGSVQGAQTGGLGAGAAMLPSVGAHSPVDVSALRAAWREAAVLPVHPVAQQPRVNTALALIVATMLGLAGGVGQVMYMRRKEGRS